MGQPRGADHQQRPEERLHLGIGRLDGHTPIDTGSTKVGSLIGDHTKTSIGALLNTGSYVGAMCLIAHERASCMPKFLPSFSWFLEGVVTKGFGKKALYDTARTAMGRRKCSGPRPTRRCGTKCST